MLTLNNIRPVRTARDGAEHMAIIGQTGTGKSTLARFILRPVTGALGIFDPKRDFKLADVDKTIPIFTRARDIWRKKPERFCYRPRPELLASMAEMDSVFRYCFEHGKMHVYIDDVTGIIQTTRPPHYMLCCYTMGRSLGINMVSCFQRPANLPLVMTSEAQKYAVFRLSEPADIKRVRSYVIGYDPATIKREAERSGLKPKHCFAFYDADLLDNCEVMMLNLK